MVCLVRECSFWEEKPLPVRVAANYATVVEDEEAGGSGDTVQRGGLADVKGGGGDEGRRTL